MQLRQAIRSISALFDKIIGTVSDPDFGAALLYIRPDPDSRYPKQRRNLPGRLAASVMANAYTVR